VAQKPYPCSIEVPLHPSRYGAITNIALAEHRGAPWEIPADTYITALADLIKTITLLRTLLLDVYLIGLGFEPLAFELFFFSFF
jgi:hypothetical protein